METVTAANLNQSTYNNWQVSGVGVVSAAGDMVYASAANAMARLAKGTANQMLVMNAGATAPSWADHTEQHIPLVFGRTFDGNSTYKKVTEGYWTYTAADYRPGFTAYFEVVWSAPNNGAGGVDNASVGLRNITNGSDAWRSSSLALPVAERRDRNAITLTNAQNYQVWAHGDQAGQGTYIFEAKVVLVW